MAYVEWLRVRGALKWTAIVLGILFALLAVARVGTIGFDHHAMAMGANHEMKFEYFAGVGAIVAMIVATILGAPFARENDGHLEVSLAKPVDRIGLALETIGADVAGIVAALALGSIFAIAAHTLFYPPWITFGFDDVIALALSFAAPLAWYAMLAAATASLKRGYAAILGLAWPVAAIVVALSLVPGGDNALLTIIHDTFWALSRIDPLAYAHLDFNSGQAMLDPAWSFQLTMLATLALGYGALAVIQWRRVEA